MENKANDFCVASKGYCFLCMNKISPQFTPVKPGHTLDNSSPSVYSLQDISRYLKFDMRKVFIDEGPVPPQLLAKVEKSRLKVELCQNCGSLTDNVSKLCRQLEKLKLEVESGLELINGKIFEANQAGMTEQFRKIVGSELSSGMGGWMEILTAMRMEAMQKCSCKKNAASPRLRIQKLTSKEVHKRTFRTPKKEAAAICERFPVPEIQCNTAKLEEPNCANTASWTLEDVDNGENSFVDDWDENADDSTSAFRATKFEPAQHPFGATQAMEESETASMDNNSQQKWIYNPETGKYKCQLCPVELSSSGIRNHYDTVHRKVRIKCKICGKEFTQQSIFRRHHRNVHMGLRRFQCQVCQKIFSRKDNLICHQRKTGCTN